MKCIRSLKYFWRTVMVTHRRRETEQVEWTPVRSGIINPSEGALGATERLSSNIPSHAIPLPKATNSMGLRVAADTNVRTGTMHVYGVRKDNGTVCRICSVTITAGAQLSDWHSASVDVYFVHQMSITNYWWKDVIKADGDGNDGMARLAFDTLGLAKVFVRFDGTGTWWLDYTLW
jgi:hypothetical protein